MYSYSKVGSLVHAENGQVHNILPPVAIRLAKRGDRIWMNLERGKVYPFGWYRLREAAKSINQDWY